MSQGKPAKLNGKKAGTKATKGRKGAKERGGSNSSSAAPSPRRRRVSLFSKAYFSRAILVPFSLLFIGVGAYRSGLFGDPMSGTLNISTQFSDRRKNRIETFNENQQRAVEHRMASYKDRLLSEHEDDPLWGKTHKITAVVSLEMEINDEGVGRVIMGLYGHAAPLAVKNMLRLCDHRYYTAALGNPRLGPAVSLAGSKCHRIATNQMIQCGEVTNKAKKTSEAAFPDGIMKDDPMGLHLQHDGKYVLEMDNAGPDTNTGVFSFMLKADPERDGKNVVFGRVVAGYEVLDQISGYGTQSGNPLADVTIYKTEVLAGGPIEFPEPGAR
mmetsp:Transcript_13730/g.49968  ORF Transcript_13730/g.49968 Transcript_13730/m.49968 type:complete len:327 (+) Transcript_13730:176-1156(+)